MLHTQGPVDGSLYAKVRKKSASDPGVAATRSPDHGDHTLSVSSDSGHSSASARTDRTEEHAAPGAKRGLSPQEKAELDQLLSGFGLEDSGSPPKDAMTDSRSKFSGTRHIVPAQVHVNGDTTPKDRETDILDDEMPGHDLHSVDSIGTLSSSEGHPSTHLGPFACHQSSHHSLLCDGFGGSAGEDPQGALGLRTEPAYGRERAFGGRQPPLPPPPVLGAPCVPAATQAYERGGYSTQTWVRQQQMVAAHQYGFAADGEARLGARGPLEGPRPAQAPPRIPATPAGGPSNGVAVQRGAGPGPHTPDAQRPPPGRAPPARLPDVMGVNGTNLERSADPAPASPTLDIDQSIEQLNRLILELDPTFEPLPTHNSTLGSPASVGGGLRAGSHPLDRAEGPGRAPTWQGELASRAQTPLRWGRSRVGSSQVCRSGAGGHGALGTALGPCVMGGRLCWGHWGDVGGARDRQG